MVNVGWWANDDPLFLGHGIRFGNPKQHSQPLHLTMDQRTRHLVCIGGSGGGKSRFARLLLTADLRCNRQFVLVDAQDLVREILWLAADLSLPGRLTDESVAQLGDKLLVIEPAAVQALGASPGYNFLAPRPGVTVFELVDNLIQLLTELWPESMGPRLIDISRNSLLCLAELGYTIAEMPLFLSDATVRSMLVRRCQNVQVQQFFLQHLAGLRVNEQRIWFESSRNKWASFVTPMILPLVGQGHSTFSFDDILANGKDLLLNLSRHHLKLESRSVLGGMFINALHGAALAREDTPPQQRYLFNIYIDEAQSYWTETLAEILEAGRKYGLALHNFFQSTRQKPFDTNRGAIDTIMANSHCRVCFSVARQDAERMAMEFLNPSGTAVKFQQQFLGLPAERPTFWSMSEEHQNFVAELMHQQPKEAYVSLKGLTDNPLPYQLTVPHVSDIQPHPEKVAALREHVARRYARPLDQVMREINQRWEQLRAQAMGQNQQSQDFFQ